MLKRLANRAIIVKEKAIWAIWEKAIWYAIQTLEGAGANGRSPGSEAKGFLRRGTNSRVGGTIADLPLTGARAKDSRAHGAGQREGLSGARSVTFA